MATATASPPSMISSSSSLSPKPGALPPLITTVTPRRASSQRVTSYANKRMSSYSTASKRSNTFESRPGSHVFPIFHSHLQYTLVRDFAYSITHPLHYGPSPTPSNMSTPVSENRRMSDPAISDWSAVPPWISPNNLDSFPPEQLPAMSFSDGGPPYSEDEDLHSPIVTSSRHKKLKSTGNFERGRSPGVAVVSDRGERTDSHGYKSGLNGPGEAVLNVPNPRRTPHRDSNFAKPLQSSQAPDLQDIGSGDEDSGAEDDSDDTRFSKDYSFTIASPDEEMHGKAVALFDFTSEHHNELPLREGQIILITYRQSQGWLVAQDPRTGESGLVPEEFVRLVRDIEGGLNGLQMDVEDDSVDYSRNSHAQYDEHEDVPEPTSDATPIANNHAFPPHLFHSAETGGGNASGNCDTSNSSSSNTTSNGNTSSSANRAPSTERHPPVQSTFSTSKKDLEPYPIPEEVKEQEKQRLASPER